MNLLELFDHANGRQASALHLASGETPRLRIQGELVPLDAALDLPELLVAVLTPETRARLGAGLAVERTIVHGDLAFHGVVFRTGEDGLVATFAILPRGVPPFETIMEGAEPFFRGLVEKRRGLILVVGPTGSGKTTTALALTNEINRERGDRIFVVGLGASHLFESERGLVTHLRVGQDCESYVRAFEIAHQSDLDVLATDDLPTLEALRQALLLAEFGHLVIANLQAPTAAEAVGRLLESAGDEAPALRRSLADNLVAVTGQRLVPSADGTRRVPVYEWIANTPRVREALLNGGDLAAVQAEDPDCRVASA